MKRRILTVLLVLGLCVGTASAQFGFGIVYDPTNYANAVLRYSQLVQQLNQLRQTYTANRAAIQPWPFRWPETFRTCPHVTMENELQIVGLHVVSFDAGGYPTTAPSAQPLHQHVIECRASR